MRKEVRQRGLRSSDNVIMSLRIPTLAINERELSGVKKASSVTMEYCIRNCIRSTREPRIIYLFDLNNESEDGSSSLFFIFRTSTPLSRILFSTNFLRFARFDSEGKF